MKKLHLFIIWVALATLIISGCLKQSNIITGSKNDYTPEDIIKIYKINEQNPPAEHLSESDAREFFGNFYMSLSKTYPEHIEGWATEFQQDLSGSTVKEAINEKTTAVFRVHDSNVISSDISSPRPESAYYIYSLKNTPWAYFVVDPILYPVPQYLKEYTKKEKDRYKEWFMLKSSDELVEKSQTKRILEDFYKVQKQMLSMDMKIKREGYYPQNFSDIINEFDSRLVKDPIQAGILNEKNTIIVRPRNASNYKEKISNYAENLLLLYRLKNNDAFLNRRPIVLDEKTLRIIYADFGGQGYLYEKIEYINN
nr:MAG: hypothetical protein OI720_00235 [Candidatus Methanoperedens sp.]